MPGPPAQVPAAAWPEAVRVAVRAIAARDAAALAARFPAIDEIPVDAVRGRYVTGAAALAALAGCRRTGVTRRGDAYAIAFACPGHTRAGCDSGDISVGVAHIAWLETLTLRHERAFSTACPLFVAPPLPPRLRRQP